MQSISQSLAGRVAVLHLLPFSLQELRNSSMKIKNADEWMFLGGYPRLHQRKINPEDFYPSYVQTYLERDVRLLKNIGDLARFQKFLAMCAARTGQEVNLNSLATDCAITVNTAKSWISILQTSFVVYLMQPYFNNFNKRLIKSPKLYFYDTGLACYLLKIKAANQLGTHFLRGGLFENMVVSETLKYYYNNGKVPDIYYWKDKTGHEIDLLIDRGTKSPAAFEIKSGLTRNKEYFINFNYWNKLLGNSENRNAVIYSGTETLRASYGDYIPFNKFDLVLKTL
jgi:predicted AAA+ superfamily ATPase